MDWEKFLHTSLLLCAMLSCGSFQLGVFWISESEAAGHHHQRPLLARALFAIIEGCLTCALPLPPQIFLHKSSFLPKLKDLPDEGSGDYLVVGMGSVIFWAGVCEGWVRRCWVQAVRLGDVSGLCNFARTLPCYTAALWLSKNKWVTYPTAKDRQWEVSVWYFHTQKSSPKLELQYKIPIQTSPAFCFHWLPSPVCTHRVPSFLKENSTADKGHLSRQVITEQASFCVCVWFLSQC